MALRKWLVLITVAVSAIGSGMGTAQADNPQPDKHDLAGASGDATDQRDWADLTRYYPDPAAYAQKLLNQAPREPKSCAELNDMYRNIELVLTEADLDGGNGTKLCVMDHLEGDELVVFLLNQRSIDEWRATKSQYLPALAQRGIDLCTVSSWTSLNTNIAKAQTYNDRQSQERPCDPIFISHGPESDARIDQVKRAFALAGEKAEELFGWRPSFTVQVHVYDEHIDFVKGVWVDGGDDVATPRSLEDVGGVSMILARGQSGLLLDLSNFEDEAGLQMLVAHEFAHIAQGSMLGCTCTAPFWAVEGGAEYFASRVVGADERHLLQRFRSAVNDQYAKTPPTLKKINTKPRDSKLELAAYSRGYAAFRYMAELNGDDAFSRLHRDRPTGSVDRYLAGLTSITGQTLDDFDAGLANWLRDAAATLPVRTNPPNTTIQPNATVSFLAAARVVGRNTIDEVASYGSRDAGAVIATEWRCISKAVKGEVVLYTPGNARFIRIGFTVQPGCGELVLIPFNFDAASGGRTARGQPGAWRVEVTADGVLQGSTSFRID